VRAPRASRAPSAPPFVIAAALFVASAAFTIWRNSEVGVLVDIAYPLNTATRIAAGEVPYKDFPLAQAPLEFLIQAALIKLFGPQFVVQIAYAAIVGGASIVLAFVIVRRLLRDAVRAPGLLAASLCLPLVPLGVYAVYPHPFYDPDACALALAVLLSGLVALAAPTPARCALAGALLSIVPFMKQNVGGALVASMAVAIAVDAFARPGTLRAARWYAIGFGAALALIALAVQFVIGIPNYVRWTVGFALEARGVTGERLQEFVVPSLLAVVLAVLLPRLAPTARLIVASAAFLAALAFTVLSRALIFAPGFIPPVLVASVALALFRSRRERPSFALLLPVVVAGTAIGFLQSNGLSSSSFAIFPLLVIALAAVVRDVTWAVPARPGLAVATGGALAGLLLVLGSIYTLTNTRLAFVDVNAVGALSHSTFPTLAGLSARGPYLADLDEILVWTRDHVGVDEGFVFLPGEGPAFYALGRRPVLPSVYFFDVATPYTPDELARIADERGLRWVFVKDRLQLVEEPPLTGAIVRALTARATLVATVGAYRVYRRD